MVSPPKQSHGGEKQEQGNPLFCHGRPTVNDCERRKGNERDARQHHDIRPERHEHHTGHAERDEIMNALVDLPAKLPSCDHRDDGDSQSREGRGQKPGMDRTVNQWRNGTRLP